MEYTLYVVLEKYVCADGRLKKCNMSELGMLVLSHMFPLPIYQQTS